MINRQTYALKPRGGMYKDMLKKCPMKDCNGKPHPDRMRRIFICDKCENKYTISYIPYLRRHND